jgi:murein DD-endopeptidase MepM/ murein hydrolase activator NlpD
MTVDRYEKRCKVDVMIDRDENGNPRLGVPANQESYADSQNFLYPWSDTFCEFRGREDKAHFFCGPNGRLVEGIHYGTDVRGPTQDPSTRIPIIAVTHGIITYVGRTWRKDKKQECTADPLLPHQSPNCDVGYEVKLRSIDEPNVTFVYRHMNPEWSPFAIANGATLRLNSEVKAGQVIGYMHGYMDHTPLGTSKHLHFEIEYALPEDLLNTCTRIRGGKKVQLCATPAKAPPYPSLLVAYLRERYGYQVDLSQRDPKLGVAVLPKLPNEITGDELRATGYAIGKLAPLVSQSATSKLQHVNQ